MNDLPETVDGILFRMNQELTCPICLTLFTHCTSTPCGHTFCRACILHSLSSLSKCPICKETVAKRGLYASNSIDAVVQEFLILRQHYENDTGQVLSQIPTRLYQARPLEDLSLQFPYPTKGASTSTAIDNTEHPDPLPEEESAHNDDDQAVSNSVTTGSMATHAQASSLQRCNAAVTDGEGTNHVTEQAPSLRQQEEPASPSTLSLLLWPPPPACSSAPTSPQPVIAASSTPVESSLIITTPVPNEIFQQESMRHSSTVQPVNVSQFPTSASVSTASSSSHTTLASSSSSSSSALLDSTSSPNLAALLSRSISPAFNNTEDTGVDRLSASPPAPSHSSAMASTSKASVSVGAAQALFSKGTSNEVSSASPIDRPFGIIDKLPKHYLIHATDQLSETTFTYLDELEQQGILRLIKKAHVSPKVTHFVFPTSVEDHTITFLSSAYLQALVLRKRIVHETWIHKCHEKMTIVDASPYYTAYIGNDQQSYRNGPLRARVSALKGEAPLFVGKQVYFHESVNIKLKKEFMNLMVAGGGQVIQTQDEMTQQTVILCQSLSKKKNDQMVATLQAFYGKIPISVTWMTQSILRYELLEEKDFAIESSSSSSTSQQGCINGS